MKGVVLIVAWVVLIALCFQPLLSYESKPAQQKAAEAQWPQNSVLGRRAEVTLVMFVHPKCPCSRANLRQLEKLICATQSTPMHVIVMFAQPEGKDASWSKTDLWTIASRIPSTDVLLDKDEQEAQRFGATSSGETYVFSKTGKLLFHGGLTAARGHEGDSPGCRIITQLARQGSSDNACTTTYGCPLFNKEIR